MPNGAMNRCEGYRASAKVLCFFLFFGGACDHSVGFLDPGASDSTDTGDGDGTVQRAALAVTVEVGSEDRELSDLLGFSEGRLEGAEVTVERQGSTEGPLTATADASGRVEFEELLPGRYAVSTLRALTPEEVAVLGPEHADVTGFGGGRGVTVEAPGVEARLEAVAGRRGSLVISELSFMTPPFLETGGSYFLGHYVELYNNSDTTMYLDGKVIVKGIVWVRDFQDELACDSMARWRLDPEGLWTRWIYAFPGSGRQFGLAPGEAVVVATDAINHREQIHETLLDLTDADFEFRGPSDVDNPAVPDMRRLGDDWPGSGCRNCGHGLYFTSINEILAVAEPVDVDDLPVDFLPVNTPRFWRVPADKILDVGTFSLTPEREAGLTGDSPPCEHMVHPSFDRQFASLIDSEKRNAIARRLFATLPDGRVILQRTKTSARDFEGRLPSPGSVPAE